MQTKGAQEMAEEKGLLSVRNIFEAERIVDYILKERDVEVTEDNWTNLIGEIKEAANYQVHGDHVSKILRRKAVVGN